MNFPEETPETRDRPEGQAETEARASGAPSSKARSNGTRRSRKPTRPAISIVIPAYNEAGKLRGSHLQELADRLNAEPYTYEVLIVDDGSEDDTAEIVERFCADQPRFSLIRNPHMGKAQAVMTGVLKASGKHVLFMDMDLATSLEHVGEFLQKLESGKADIVIASRESKGSRRIGTPMSRRVMGKAFNQLVQLLLLPGLKDTQCGFKAFRREVAEDLFGSMRVFADARPVKGPLSTAFDVELLVMARRRKYRVRELPVRWRHVDTRNVSAVRDPHRMFMQVLRIWSNDRRGLYRPSRS